MMSAAERQTQARAAILATLCLACLAYSLSHRNPTLGLAAIAIPGIYWTLIARTIKSQALAKGGLILTSFVALGLMAKPVSAASGLAGLSGYLGIAESVARYSSIAWKWGSRALKFFTPAVPALYLYEWGVPQTIFNGLRNIVAGPSFADLASRCFGRIESHNCILCNLIGQFVEDGGAFVALAYAGLSSEVLSPLVGDIYVLLLLIAAFRILGSPGQLQQHVGNIGKTTALFALVLLLLSPAGLALVIQGFLATWLKTAFELGNFMIQTLGIGQNAPQIMHGISRHEPTIAIAAAELWGQNEAAVWPIICVTADRMAAKFSSLAEFGNLIQLILLAIPYVLVLLVVLAYFMQVIFYFIGIGAALPLLLTGLLVPFLRASFVNAMRVLITGSLTLIFAAVAMSFSASLLRQYGGYIVDEVVRNAEAAQAAYFTMGNPQYWTLFLLGWAAMLLHLQAPKIAANLGGASDSAATAGAVVAAGQLVGARGLHAVRGAAFGNDPGRLGGLLGTPFNHAAEGLSRLRRRIRGVTSDN